MFGSFENRLVFVSGQMMDPAGMPIHPNPPAAPKEEAVEAPSEAEPDSVRAEEQRGGGVVIPPPPSGEKRSDRQPGCP